MSSQDETIDVLKGFSSRTLNKLRAAGIVFLKDLLIFTPKRLAEFAGISEETAEKLINKALQYLEETKRDEFWFEKAGDLRRKRRRKCSSRRELAL